MYSIPAIHVLVFKRYCVFGIAQCPNGSPKFWKLGPDFLGESFWPILGGLFWPYFMGQSFLPNFWGELFQPGLFILGKQGKYQAEFTLGLL